MNVASLELSKELHELSGWYSDLTYENTRTEENPFIELGKFKYSTFVGKDGVVAPAYDLGYLLRKLPPETIIKYDLTDGWVCFGRFKEHTVCRADTPEDAACKLAIELFKQGVLTRE